MKTFNNISSHDFSQYKTTSCVNSDCLSEEELKRRDIILKRLKSELKRLESEQSTT